MTWLIALLFPAFVFANPIGSSFVGKYKPLRRDCMTLRGSPTAVTIKMFRNELWFYGVINGSNDAFADFNLGKAGRTETLRRAGEEKQIRRSIRGRTLLQEERGCMGFCGKWNQVLKVTQTSENQLTIWHWGDRCDLVRVAP